ncbi:hypothetical protein C0995_002878, partial [Termitomyces sp. Mi166
MVQAAKAFFKHQGKPLRSFVGKVTRRKEFMGLMTDSEKTGVKRVLKSKDIVESNSNKEEEEER